MGDLELRLLQRAAAVGDFRDRRRFERASARSRRCIPSCEWKDGGEVSEGSGEGELFLWRLLCWTCGAIKLEGSTHSETLVDKAYATWGDDLGEHWFLPLIRGAPS